MEPTINKDRIHLIDLIRGFALIGFCCDVTKDKHENSSI